MAYESTLRALAKAQIYDYEIIIVTNLRLDGSNDGTPDIADAIAGYDLNVRHIYNADYVNIGYKFRQSIRVAKKEYVTWFPGDNELTEDSMVEILKHTGQADIIAVYTANQEVRALKRRLASKGFIFICNLLFGLNLKYFNGHCIIRRKLVMAVPMSTDSFAFMAEILIYLIRSGVKYIEVPMRIRPITNISSSFKLKSVIECYGLLAKLFWKINILQQRVVITDTPLT